MHDVQGQNQLPGKDRRCSHVGASVRVYPSPGVVDARPGRYLTWVESLVSNTPGVVQQVLCFSRSGRADDMDPGTRRLERGQEALGRISEVRSQSGGGRAHLEALGDHPNVLLWWYRPRASDGRQG